MGRTAMVCCSALAGRERDRLRAYGDTTRTHLEMIPYNGQMGFASAAAKEGSSAAWLAVSSVLHHTMGTPAQTQRLIPTLRSQRGPSKTSHCAALSVVRIGPSPSLSGPICEHRQSLGGRLIGWAMDATSSGWPRGSNPIPQSMAHRMNPPRSLGKRLCEACAMNREGGGCAPLAPLSRGLRLFDVLRLALLPSAYSSLRRLAVWGLNPCNIGNNRIGPTYAAMGIVAFRGSLA
jgi:hypothetical protein